MSEHLPTNDRRIDPEPFTIIAAVAGVVGGATGAIALWRDIKRPLPSRVRSRLLQKVDSLDAHLEDLGADVGSIEALFSKSDFPNGRTFRLGNGARMTLADFKQYERVSSAVFRRLSRIHRDVLALEKATLNISYLDEEKYTHHIGEYGGNLEKLLASLDLSIEESWQILHDSIQHIRELCQEVRRQLK